MKIIKMGSDITVVLKNGEIISVSNCTEELFQEVLEFKHDEETVINLLLPEFNNKIKEAEQKQAIFEGIDESTILTAKGKSMYMLDVSELSLPEDLVKKILKAESEGDIELLKTYINFWTLTSLNPDSRVRQNLFWFLNKYGMNISKSGLFVAYRNVHIKNKDSIITQELAEIISSEYIRVKFKLRQTPSDYNLYFDNNEAEYVVFTDKEYENLEDEYDSLNYDYECDDIDHPEDYLTYRGNLAELYAKLSESPEAPVYTDGYTKTFNIKIGDVVSMPREKCDSVQEHTCSTGLHVAGKSWLSRHYFGDVGMMVLVNPADVVAVPPQDNYGKMRTAAYYPVSIVDFDEDGNLIGTDFDDGFEDDFVDKIVYNGERNRDDSNPYSIVIPDIPELDKSKINDKLIKLARQFNKIVK